MGRKVTRGLTLAETLVSLTILTMVMVAVLNLFPSSMTVVHMTRTGWLARAAAQDKIEAIASQTFPSIVVPFEESIDIVLSDGSRAHLKTTVSAVTGHAAKHLKRIRCEATWRGKSTEKKASQELYVHSIRR